MNSPVSPRRRSRRNTAAQDTSPSLPQLPYQQVRSSFAPVAPLSEDQLQAIHRQSLKIIAELGVKVLCPDLRRALKAKGCTIRDEIVCMDPGFVEDMVAKAPSSFTLTPRYPDHAIAVGGNVMNFGLVSGPPSVHDTINGRRSGNFADFKNLIRLGQSLNCIHFMGNQACATNDLAVNTRHLDSLLATLTLSDKITSTMSIGAGRVRDAAQMLAIARGLTLDELKSSPTAMTNINVNSPRVLDKEMSSAALELASLGQAVIITPFTLMGAMTPVTFAAALSQQNAEALFTIAVVQSMHPGAPVVYGGFTSNVDMKSGAPAFGTPENSRANMAGGQLARHYGVPYRTSACNASNCVDGQAAYETQMALWGAVMGQGNMIYHGAGWLEGGLVASFEKVIMDAEMLQMMISLTSAQNFDDGDFGFEAMDEVGTGGHFFGCDHTMSRYKSAFYAPILSDWSNNESWLEQGGKTATERAAVIWQEMLRTYREPALDPAIAEQLNAFVIRRKLELGANEP
ncbi:MAG: trimethylamine methyltransferase family protein [Alphaproteobacteria bacterium]|nr:trimethylamine methyltransferase family protein [Alphaproteobacteria bacterium]